MVLLNSKFGFQTLEEECKQTICDCELIYVVGAGTFTQKQLIAFNSVNCSHRGLTEMPSFLPANTTTLRVTGNKVLLFLEILINNYRSLQTHRYIYIYIHTF